MESNDTITLEEECDRDVDCLFVAGDGLFKVWHVILIVAAILVVILVIVLRCFKCPRLPEEARKKKEREIRRQEMEGGTSVQPNSTDGHAIQVRSPYEGNVDQPLDPPGNVDLPMSPPAPSQEVNVVYNPSAVHTPSAAAAYKPPSARYSRHSHEPSDSVELRYIRSRTTSEVRDSLRDSYYHENTGAHSPSHNQPNGNSSSHIPPVMSTSTRI